MKTIVCLLPLLVMFGTACQQSRSKDLSSLAEAKVDFGNVQFIAHMGLSSKAPANTLPAFELAGKSGGFIGIETDVRETKDGEFVLYHDEDLKSRTTGSGTVISQTLANIQTYNISKGNKLSEYKDLKVPLLDDYLEICKKYHVKPVLHIKSVTDAGVKKLLDKLVVTDLFAEAIITGGKKDMMRFRKANKDVTIYWMNLLSNSGTDWAATENMHVNSDVADVTASEVAYAHKKGLKVGAWTVNDTKTIETLAKAGVDYVTTDNLYRGSLTP